MQQARNLRVLFDAELSFNKHISKLSQVAHMHVRQLRRIRPCLDLGSAVLLANTLVSSRIDYCNSIFMGCLKILFCGFSAYKIHLLV